MAYLKIVLSSKSYSDSDFLSERSPVVLVQLGRLTALRLSSYGQPKYENRVFAKTQNGLQRFGLASKFFGQKIKVAHFCESLEECKNWDLSDKN